MAGAAHPILWSNLSGINPALSEALGVADARHVVYSWLAMLILLIVGLMVRGRVKMVPGGLQNFLETLIGGLREFVVGIVGKDGHMIYPIVGAIFIYIATMNLLGLVPGCDAPTANINTTLSMGIFAFLYYNAVGLWRWKVGYIKHFMGPVIFLAPLMLILEPVSHIIRPASLALRLFGNIFGEEQVLTLFFNGAPVWGTVPIYFLFLLAKLLQAFIFFMLTTIYLKGSLEHAH